MKNLKTFLFVFRHVVQLEQIDADCQRQSGLLCGFQSACDALKKNLGGIIVKLGILVVIDTPHG